MKKEVENYIDTTLSKIAILDELNVAFEAVEILDFKTEYENGDAFTRQNGDLYALAILNAITQESYYEINRSIKKEKNLDVGRLKKIVASHYLKCHVTGDSEAYNTWKTGDIGVVVLEANEQQKAITPIFSNQTSVDRD